jgi:large repetitive protein
MPVKSFYSYFLCLVCLVGLLVVKVSTKKLPVTDSVVTNSANAWLDNYLLHHPYAPLLSNVWRTVALSLIGIYGVMRTRVQFAHSG